MPVVGIIPPFRDCHRGWHAGGWDNSTLSRLSPGGMPVVGIIPPFRDCHRGWHAGGWDNSTLSRLSPGVACRWLG